MGGGDVIRSVAAECWGWGGGEQGSRWGDPTKEKEKDGLVR